jgi:glycosyltransferase involved in cell wall biosynthesis
MNLSVIVCSHNPHKDYLKRSIESLRCQDCSLYRWELLLIDNASKPPLSDHVDLAWHPHSRYIREEKLGLTHARLRGISEAIGSIFVFVDDDNVLCDTYLTDVIDIAQRYPLLGVFGAAHIVAEFEAEPDAWALPYLPMLALRDERGDFWGNDIKLGRKPYGAGLCITRQTGEAYQCKLVEDPLRFALGRNGVNLASCEDYDIAKVATEQGLGFGIFDALRLTHLISKQRVRKDYLLRLKQGMAESHALLYYIWYRSLPDVTLDRQSFRQKARRIFKGKSVFEEFQDAQREGEQRALNLISGL